MSLPSPNLDDRDFRQLLAEARQRIATSCPAWTDLSPSDPGMVLVELFAHLTETMIYRLNRVPEKAYVEFLRLLGVELRPPAAAVVELTFRRARAGDKALTVPRGTRVAAGQGPVFLTARPAVIAPGETETTVLAYGCELVERELAGTGTGLPGQSVVAARPPLVAPTGDELDLMVAVEADPAELDERVPAVEHGGRTWRIWREVEAFTNLGEDGHVYTVDRVSGRITFAPAVRSLEEGGAGALAELPRALAEVPALGKGILLSYRRGGGPEGNLAAGALTVLKDPIPGVEVVNLGPATGGRSAESVDNALVRGPQELHSLERAVTGRDFELLALKSSASVARARALTRAELWAHARPGTVEVLLVPALPAEARPGGRVEARQLAEQEREEVRRRVLAALSERRPLGTQCLAHWTRTKTVRVSARVVVYRQENSEAVRERVLRRLDRLLSPLPVGDGQERYPGWPFGQALRASHVYDTILAEPGVAYADEVRMLVDEVPEVDVRCLAADRFQPGTWYAGSGETLYRSLNDGDGWEPAGRFPGEGVAHVAAHPDRSGHLAVATEIAQGGGSRLHLSADCGETWAPPAGLGFTVEDLAWIERGGIPVLLLATEKGLYELPVREGATPVQILVEAAEPDLGFYAVAAATDIRGTVNVAVAARGRGGVYLSIQGARGESFRKIGQGGEDVRVLRIQADGPRLFLWAGRAAEGGSDSGKGCASWELRGSADPPEGWVERQAGWKGGSCHDLAFEGTAVLAATHEAGVLRLAAEKGDAPWWTPDVDSHLPMRDRGRFQPVRAVAANREGSLLLSGHLEGVSRSRDGGITYEPASSREFRDKVTLPQTWLFTSGEHDIQVVSEDEANSD